MSKSSNSVERYGSKGRQDLLQFDPEDIALITDVAHPLYDPRVGLPVDESMVLNIMANGVLEPIGVRRNGEKDGVPVIECVYGRQRVKAAREANKRLAKEGKQTIRVPAVIKRGGDGVLFGMLISENEGRQDDSPVDKAKKIARYLEHGRTTKDAAVMFCCSEQSIKDKLALLDLDKSVQKAVETGKIGATLAAHELSKLPREEQKDALDKLVEAGVTKGAAAKQAARQIRTNGKQTRVESRLPPRKGRKDLEKAIKALRKAETRDALLAAAAIKFTLGYDSALNDYPSAVKALFPDEE